jgi:hypothetical protein
VWAQPTMQAVTTASCLFRSYLSFPDIAAKAQAPSISV